MGKSKTTTRKQQLKTDWKEAMNLQVEKRGVYITN